MNIHEAITQISLKQWPDLALVFAERIDGKFRPESKVVVLELSERELSRPWREVAEEKAET